MTEALVKTTFLIISDTHTLKLHEQSANNAFRQPVPEADVLLHCGDLTMNGEHEEYEEALRMLASIPARRKFVIAGNHDKSLDAAYWQTHLPHDLTLDYHRQAVAMWTGAKARNAGVEYLDEGLYTIELDNGARFTLYASPYQPEFCDFAFPYERNEDRFNSQQQALQGATSIAERPVPDYPDVDVMMTHGPPYGVLDRTVRGAHQVGCANLSRAAQRARPRLYCFGHIHEGYGAQVVTWSDVNKTQSIQKPEGILTARDLPVDLERAVKDRCVTLDTTTLPTGSRLRSGQETLCINASIMSVRYRPVQAPWLVTLELPRKPE